MGAHLGELVLEGELVPSGSSLDPDLDGRAGLCLCVCVCVELFCFVDYAEKSIKSSQ